MVTQNPSSDTALQQTYALVVGIDRYPNMPQDWKLHGCVNDACAVVSWLVTEKNIAPGHIKLFLSPDPDKPVPALPAGVSFSEAEEHRIVDYLAKDLPGLQGSLFLFYWAGHGATYRDDRHLLYTDFLDNGKRTLNTKMLKSHLRSLSEFRKQILIIDACADHAENKNFHFDEGDLSRDAFKYPHDQQFLYAAQVGQRAAESKKSQLGFFTGHLMSSLRSQTDPDAWPPDMKAVVSTLYCVFQDMNSKGKARQTPAVFVSEDVTGRDDFELINPYAGRNLDADPPTHLYLLCDRRDITREIGESLQSRRRTQEKKPLFLIVTGMKEDCPRSLTERLRLTNVNRKVEGKVQAVYPAWTVTRQTPRDEDPSVRLANLVENVYNEIQNISEKPPANCSVKLAQILEAQAVRSHSAILIVHDLLLEDWNAVSQKVLDAYIAEWQRLDTSATPAQFVVLFQCILGSCRPDHSLRLLFPKARMVAHLPKVAAGRRDYFPYEAPFRLDRVRIDDIKRLYEECNISYKDDKTLRSEFRGVFSPLTGAARMAPVEERLKEKFPKPS